MELLGGRMGLPAEMEPLAHQAEWEQREREVPQGFEPGQELRQEK